MPFATWSLLVNCYIFIIINSGKWQRSGHFCLHTGSFIENDWRNIGIHTFFNSMAQLTEAALYIWFGRFSHQINVLTQPWKGFLCPPGTETVIVHLLGKCVNPDTMEPLTSSLTKTSENNSTGKKKAIISTSDQRNPELLYSASVWPTSHVHFWLLFLHSFWIYQ